MDSSVKTSRGSDAADVASRPARRPQARGVVTRERMLRAAERLFVKYGYDNVGVDRIVKAAAVTKGAFYHHFGDKLAIFREVFEAIDQEMSDIVRARALTAETPLGIVQRGVRTCFELCTQPRYGRLVYIVAPSVLGWAAWHEKDSAIAREVVTAGLENAVAEGELAPLAVSSLATLLLGSILQGAIAIATSSEPERTAVELAAETDRLLLALAAQARARA